jgi:hypothetical protein
MDARWLVPGLFRAQWNQQLGKTGLGEKGLRYLDTVGL